MEINETNKMELSEKLQSIYGEETKDLVEHLMLLMNHYKHKINHQNHRDNRSLTEEDIILITYGNSIYEGGKPSLQVLESFLKDYVGTTFSAVHVLPFFPYSSDDGFAVIDYFKVDERLGDWSDIYKLSSSYDLMFDAVVNHISSQSKWFQKFLSDEEPYNDFS